MLYLVRRSIARWERYTMGFERVKGVPFLSVNLTTYRVNCAFNCIERAETNRRQATKHFISFYFRVPGIKFSQKQIEGVPTHKMLISIHEINCDRPSTF